jgi:hypothetical protein
MQSKIPELISTDSRVSVGRFTYGNPQFIQIPYWLKPRPSGR